MKMKKDKYKKFQNNMRIFIIILFLFSLIFKILSQKKNVETEEKEIFSRISFNFSCKKINLSLWSGFSYEIHLFEDFDFLRVGFEGLRKSLTSFWKSFSI